MATTVNLLRDLLDAGSVADLYVRARTVVRRLEFEHFIYGMRLHSEGGQTHEFVISGYPASWREVYGDQGYAVTDPTISHCLGSNVPLVWSSQFFITHGAAPMMEHARQYGLRSGLTVPLHSPNLQTGLLSLASEAASLDGDVERIAQSQLFGTYLHEAARRLVQQPAPSGHDMHGMLTRREKECLSWAAAGKSSWEISQIIATSERTVNFHIGNVIQKLRVSTRSHAIANALARGLIQI